VFGLGAATLPAFFNATAAVALSVFRLGIATTESRQAAMMDFFFMDVSPDRGVGEGQRTSNERLLNGAIWRKRGQTHHP
jgi:hypothetical protein